MMGKVLGIYSVVPAVVLLSIAFFVMAVSRKEEESIFKSFGRILTVFLCLIAIAMFLMGLYVASTGNCPVVNKLGSCGISGARTRMICNKVYEFGVGIGDLQLLPMDRITVYVDSPYLNAQDMLVMSVHLTSLHAGRVSAIKYDDNVYSITGDSLQAKAESLTRAEALSKVGSVSRGVSNIVCREVA